MLAGMAFNHEMGRAVPNFLAQQTMGTGDRVAVPGATGYSPNSSWWGIRLFQWGLGGWLGRMAGRSSWGLGEANKFTREP
jgi:hypothetical protein